MIWGYHYLCKHPHVVAPNSLLPLLSCWQPMPAGFRKAGTKQCGPWAATYEPNTPRQFLDAGGKQFRQDLHHAMSKIVQASNIPVGKTPLKFNMEPRNHPIEKENHLNQTSMTWGSKREFSIVSTIFAPVYPLQSPHITRSSLQVIHTVSPDGHNSIQSQWEKTPSIRFYWKTAPFGTGWVAGYHWYL